MLGGEIIHRCSKGVIKVESSTIGEQIEDACGAVVRKPPPVTRCLGENVIDHPEGSPPRIPRPFRLDCSPEILLPG